MSRVRVKVAAEQVARGAVEVQVDWKGDAADVDSAPALIVIEPQVGHREERKLQDSARACV